MVQYLIVGTLKLYLVKLNIKYLKHFIKNKRRKIKIAKRLHCQFGHASVQKLQKLVKVSSIKDDELLNLLDVIEKIVKFV